MEHDQVQFEERLSGFGWVSSLQKCSPAMGMLAYGAPVDVQDDYLRMSESTTIKAMYRFCRAVVAVFGPQYLRAPNEKKQLGSWP